MEIEELNRRLAALSESELAYRAGGGYSWNDAGELELVDGREVMRLKNDMFGGRAPVSAGAGRAPIAIDRELYIRRHSRFNPMPEHVHSYVEISYVYSGTCPQRVNGRDVLLRENQVLRTARTPSAHLARRTSWSPSA